VWARCIPCGRSLDFVLSRYSLLPKVAIFLHTTGMTHLNFVPFIIILLVKSIIKVCNRINFVN